MTQSLIAFAVLQFASLAIICAFAALERLSSGTGRLRDQLQAKAITRANEPARKRTKIPQVSPRSNGAQTCRAGQNPARLLRHLRREPNDAREPVATSRPRRAA